MMWWYFPALLVCIPIIYLFFREPVEFDTMVDVISLFISCWSGAFSIIVFKLMMIQGWS